MNQALLKTVETIVRKANDETPADSVLRDELRKQKGLSRDDGWEISRAVFTYYRWYKWLDAKSPVGANTLRALELAERFKTSPETFTDAEILKNAVPGWTGEQLELTAAFARAMQSEPALWLRCRNGERNRIASELRYCTPHSSDLLPDALQYEGSVDLFRTPQFQEGLFELQDIASQAVSVICAPKPGETWWDACAGEGGKTLHLAELMRNKGLIWASDRAEWRLKRLRQRAARAKVFNYRAASWDGSDRLPTKTKFDGVLVDAPCSGVGTWTRNPHARWTTTLKDVRELAIIQTRLLEHAAVSIKPGGKLIYSVCTLTREETTAVVESFQSRFPGFSPEPFRNPLQPGEPATPHLTIWPQDSGGNGMFVAAWRKATA